MIMIMIMIVIMIVIMIGDNDNDEIREIRDFVSPVPCVQVLHKLWTNFEKYAIMIIG